MTDFCVFLHLIIHNLIGRVIFCQYLHTEWEVFILMLKHDRNEYSNMIHKVWTSRFYSCPDLIIRFNELYCLAKIMQMFYNGILSVNCDLGYSYILMYTFLSPCTTCLLVTPAFSCTICRGFITIEMSIYFLLPQDNDYCNLGFILIPMYPFLL